MPGIGRQHARAHPARHRHQVAEQRLLGHQRGHRDPQRQRRHRLDRGGLLQPGRRRADHAQPDAQQQQTQRQRGSGLEALVAVGMVGVGFFLAMAVGNDVFGLILHGKSNVAAAKLAKAHASGAGLKGATHLRNTGKNKGDIAYRHSIRSSVHI